MLILSRKIGETLRIGENIRVVVLEVRGKQIRLGIEAPPDVLILREEILNRLAQENEQSACFQFQDMEAIAECVRHHFQPSAGLKNGSTSTLAVETRHFGRVMISESEVITFPEGLPGFTDFHRYALLESPEISPFLCLQSLEDPSLCFLTADPEKLLADYRLGNAAGAVQGLEAKEAGDLRSLVMLTIPPGQPRDLTANLAGPILINPRLHRGRQIVLENSRYSLKYPLIPPKTDAE